MLVPTTTVNNGPKGGHVPGYIFALVSCPASPDRPSMTWIVLADASMGLGAP